MAFRFTSPALKEEDRLIKECPVGVIFKESPYVYNALNAYAHSENGCFNPLESPLWLQDAFCVIASEKARLQKIKDEERRSKRDSKYGMRVRQSRHG